MYAEIFDGLRAYYASFESRRDAAGFHAAMTMSMLCCLDVAAAVPIIDVLLTGTDGWVDALYGHAITPLSIGIVIAYAHVFFGKRTGNYYSVEPAKSTRWKRYLAIYLCLTVVLVVSALLVAVRMSQHMGS